MKLHVPEIGEELTLTRDWRFSTIAEYRNQTLFDAFDVPDDVRYDMETVNPRPGYVYQRRVSKPVEFVIPAGTVLKVDRIYIRKGNEKYSSLTFYVVSSPDWRIVTKKNKGNSQKAVRFWVKLAETRNIEFADV